MDMHFVCILYNVIIEYINVMSFFCFYVVIIGLIVILSAAYMSKALLQHTVNLCLPP